MKNLITFSILVILCVSCASSRQELSTQRSSAVTKVQMNRGSDYIEGLLSQLYAKFSDSVHVVVKNYYPPKSDSDSIGPLKTEVTYQRKAKVNLDKTEHKEVHEKDSMDIGYNHFEESDEQIQRRRTVNGNGLKWFLLLTLVLSFYLFFRIPKGK